MSRAERKQTGLESDLEGHGDSSLKGQHSRRTEVCGKGLESFLGKGVPSSIRHLVQMALALSDQWPWGEADGQQGGGATLRPEPKQGQVAHTGQSPRPWHQPLGALDSRVNDSFVANFCWPLPGNSQACSFPQLQELQEYSLIYTWLRTSHPLSREWFFKLQQ